MRDAFLHPAEGGHRLYIHHAPAVGSVVRGVVVYVHPWAEEMNKSRRMASLAARQLAEEGYAVLQVDLLGCGDSSADHGDASWEAWVRDVRDAADWLTARYPEATLWLWGLRAGTLLCHAAAAQMASLPNLLFWQPAQQGKALLQQFLRLKAAAQLADGGGKAAMDEVRQALRTGQVVDVAGYRVSPSLASSLELATLAPLAVTAAATRPTPRLVWFEISPQVELELSPAAQSAAPKWTAAGWRVDLQPVCGPTFWQTTEIEDAPQLLTATLARMASVNEAALA